MTVTVTLNPSIDYTMSGKDFSESSVNRADSVSFDVGGKGINLTRTLKKLGQKDARAVGILYGKTGAMASKRLGDLLPDADFILKNPDAGFEAGTRINVKVPGHGSATEYNAPGPVADASDADEIVPLLRPMLGARDTLVFCGSLPPGLPDDSYAKICDAFSDLDLRLVADTEKAALLPLLSRHPYLIKPNRSELGRAVGGSVETERDIVLAARQLQKQGAGHVFVSLGKDGALFVPSFEPFCNRRDRGDVSFSGAPLAIPAVTVSGVTSAVGAGDALLAGLLYAIDEKMSRDNALTFAMATAAATLKQPFPDRDAVMTLYAVETVARPVHPIRHLPY